MNYRKMRNLFLRQSCQDSWRDYEKSLEKPSFLTWDYMILTASNEEQARTYREQITCRLRQGLLPCRTHYAVLPDPEGKRVGSGGATLHVLRYIAQREGEGENPFSGKRILVIHSGGDSRRVPQYSACGKLFSPVPRQLPNGLGSTLFDEFVVGMSGVPSRIPEGMLVLSGDVLLLFNPLQIDFNHQDAAAISIKESVEVGKEHGVFLNDGRNYVGQFLHKRTEERLRALGAVDGRGNVDLDTGAVILSAGLLRALYALISTKGRADETKFARFVNEKARISFYGDFLYPLAGAATWEQYEKEAAEGTMNEALLACRREIWEALSPFSMKLVCLSPAEFIHFGTTAELLGLVTKEVEDYEFLDWKRHVLSTALPQAGFSSRHSYIDKSARVEEGVYLENSYILENSCVGAGSVVSNGRLRGVSVPAGVVIHCLKLLDGRYVARVYGTEDNPKVTLEKDGTFLGSRMAEFLEKNGLSPKMLWKREAAQETDEHSLWFAALYPAAECLEEAIHLGLLVKKMAEGRATEQEVDTWMRSERFSLYESFNQADALWVDAWQHELEYRILVNGFMDALEKGTYYKEALRIFGVRGIGEEIYAMLAEEANRADFSLKIRIYYALAGYMKENRVNLGKKSYDDLEAMCFDTIQRTIFTNAVRRLPALGDDRIKRERVEVKLPVRVNWGGGWTDTPPHCNERGGAVLNAALKLNGIFPVQIKVERLEQHRVEFASTDIGASGSVERVEEIQDCHNPYDPFSLHKAALIACGIVPLTGKASLMEICGRLGGGFRLSTRVVGIPQGSGLGTSSILAGACVKGVYELLGREAKDADIYDIVLGMEQIMSTGGGWQDQVGGLTPGIKWITTRPGIDQKIQVKQVHLPKETAAALQERFALIYTGQRRLARNLLRDVVGGYLGGRPESLDALERMQSLAALMRFELERGNLDAFAELLNQHWALSRQLDAGSTNTCIEQIFLSCEDMIDGRFIAGAGGGGFLQVLLKEGVSKAMLRERLHAIFQDSGVDVWESEFV